jgi:hypothetical protein
MISTSDPNFSMKVISIFTLKELKDNNNETYFSSNSKNFLNFERKKIPVEKSLFLIKKIPQQE